VLGRWITIAFAAYAVFVLAACGGSEATPTSAAPSASVAPDAPTATATTELTPTPTPPVGIATVTVQVPAGPQTQRLLLVEGQALVIQEIDGTRTEIVRFEDGTGTPAFAVWSPSGETIAFVVRHFFRGDAEADWGDDVYLVPAVGGKPSLARAHAVAGQQVFGLAWRPDGAQLLFGQIDVELRGGVPTGIEGAAIVELDLATGAEQSIVDGAYDPSLSADGTRLAYVELGALPTETAIGAANADGSDPVVLAEPGRFEVTRFPRISPDGNTVVFTAAAPLVRSLEPTGGRLAGWLGALLGPLAPARAEAHGIPMDLWLVDSRTAALTQLTAIGEDDPYPAWTADGGTIVFLGTNGLYEVSVATGALVRTGDGRFDGQVAVAPSE